MPALNVEIQIGRSHKNRLELCGHCDEVWLDTGEWDLVKKLDLHEKLSSVFTDAWQRNILKQREASSLRDHYSQVLGEKDFEKVNEFKLWLDKHPKRAEIKHYITINF